MAYSIQRTSKIIETEIALSKPPSRRRWWLFIGCFLLALAGLRLLWLFLFLPASFEPAKNGELDLRHWNADGILALDGEWLFYPDRFLIGHPESGEAAGGNSEPERVTVPGELKLPRGSDGQASFGYGSYRLRIRLNPEDDRSYALRMSSVRTASEVYANGRLVGRSGVPAADRSEYKPLNVPYSATVRPDSDGAVDLVIQVANYDYLKGIGLANSVRFGEEAAVAHDRLVATSLQLTVFVILVVHALYAVLLFVMGFRDRRLLGLALLLITGVLLLADSGDKLLLSWLPIDYTADYRLKAFLLSAFSFAIAQSVGGRPPARWRRTGRRLWQGGLLLLAAASLCVPLQLILRYELVYMVVTVGSSSVALAALLRSYWRRFATDASLAVMALALFNMLVWEYIDRTLEIKPLFYPIDLTIAVLALSVSWFRQYLLAMAKLKEADRSKDEFLAHTSHELRNPLHGILSLAQGVIDRHRGALGDRSSRDLELVMSVGRRMSHTLGDLLDVMRLRESGIRLTRKSVPLRKTVDDVMDVLKFMLDGRPVALINDVARDDPHVEADEHRLAQILFNLLHNAIKFTPEGSIAVRTALYPEHVAIIVADTGVGIEAADLQRIFEPYEQFDAGRSAGSGFGLGLRICKQLVELHGSALSVRSTPGAGTAFEFRLRRADGQTAGTASAAAEAAASAEAPPARAAEERPRMRPGRADKPALPAVLAVDDDLVNLRALEAMLGSDYEVVCAASAREALNRLNERRWELIVADVLMPAVSGLELTMVVRERFDVYELPILLLTAQHRPEDIEAGLLAGANDYVVKPVNAIELRARVDALLGLRRLVRQRLNVEAAWLQAQIKPHLILNTLNAIVTLSEIDGDRMRSLVDDFSNYLRASFNIKNSLERIHLRHELDLIRYYLGIQKERFGDRLDVRWQVDENVQATLPPLLIQPLVENAVTHGALKRHAGGSVTIRIVRAENDAEVTVMDDGAGMSEETIRSVLHGEGGEMTGIGLWNTNMRLRQHYGRGLSISSEPGRGTAVSFRIRALSFDRPEGDL